MEYVIPYTTSIQWMEKYVLPINLDVVSDTLGWSCMFQTELDPGIYYWYIKGDIACHMFSATVLELVWRFGQLWSEWPKTTFSVLKMMWVGCYSCLSRNCTVIMQDEPNQLTPSCLIKPASLPRVGSCSHSPFKHTTILISQTNRSDILENAYFLIPTVISYY